MRRWLDLTSKSNAGVGRQRTEPVPLRRHRLQNPHAGALAGRSHPAWAWTQCAGLSGLHTRVAVATSQHAVRVTEIPRAGVITDVGHRTGPGRRAHPWPTPWPSHRHLTPDAATPEQLHRLGETAGYHVAVTWGAQPGHPGCGLPHPTDPEASTLQPLTDLYLPPAGAQPAQHPRQRPADQHQDQRGASAVERVVARLHGARADRGARPSSR